MVAECNLLVTLGSTTRATSTRTSCCRGNMLHSHVARGVRGGGANTTNVNPLQLYALFETTTPVPTHQFTSRAVHSGGEHVFCSLKPTGLYSVGLTQRLEEFFRQSPRLHRLAVHLIWVQARGTLVVSLA